MSEQHQILETTRRRLPGTPEPARILLGAGGIRLAADCWGDPSRPPVLLLHGGGQTRHAWGTTGRMLADAGFHAVAFDARGHGDSQWAPDGRYSSDAMVDDLQAVLGQLSSTPPILVGASMGGNISLIAVGEGTVAARGLVLVDITPRLESQGVARIRLFMEGRPEGFASLEEVADAVALYRPTRPRPKDISGLAKNVRQGSDGRLYWHWDPRIHTLRGDDEQRTARLHRCAANLTIPTLLVHGLLSDVVSDAGVREFLERCPHTRYLSVADAGHMVAGDANDNFATAVREFFSQVTT